MLRTRLTGTVLSASFALALLALGACYTLPKDWPVKELTLPPKTKIAADPERAQILREKLNILPEIGDRIPLHPTSTVAFITTSNTVQWDDLVASVSGQLKPLGYTEWKPQQLDAVQGVIQSIGEAKDFDSTIRIWESKDKSLIVNLINCTVLVVTGEAIDRPGDYILCVQRRAGKPAGS